MEGRVQGVFFRDGCAREARQRGLGGFVRNCSDGSVEAVFEGDADAVDQMVAWCRHGPPRAIVTGVAVEDEEPRGEGWFAVR